MDCSEEVATNWVERELIIPTEELYSDRKVDCEPDSEADCVEVCVTEASL